MQQQLTNMLCFIFKCRLSYKAAIDVCVTQCQYVCLIVYLLSAQFDTSGRRQHLYKQNVYVFGAQKNREWLEECGEALRSPPYQPEMSAAERVYIDILVDRASNIHTVTLSDRAYQIIKRCSRLPYLGAKYVL